MKLIGIGDNVVDRYTNKRIMFPGGNAVNFAAYARQCGEESAYLGFIADEREGWHIYDSLKEVGVDVSHSKPIKGLTTERCDVTLEEGDRVFIGTNYGEGEWRRLTLDEDMLGYLRTFDVIHSGCYAFMEDELRKLDNVRAIRTHDFSEEPEFRTDEYLAKVCPYTDIALFSGSMLGPDEIPKLYERVTGYGTKLVLITHGYDGQTLWDGRSEYCGSVTKVDAVDTMGAGDSFFTAFVIGLMRQGYTRGADISKLDMDEVFAFAADFSAKTCMVDGAFGFAVEY